MPWADAHGNPQSAGLLGNGAVGCGPRKVGIPWEVKTQTLCLTAPLRELEQN